MSISMYSASVPAFTIMLQNLSHILGKAQSHAEEKKFDVNQLMSYRLFPDMLPFSRQVMIACDAAKLGVARLSGVDAPKFEDNETTLAQFQERIAKTLEYLASVPADKLNGTEAKEVTFPAGPGKTKTMLGEAYLKHWVTPNMYFHITMTYAILRHNGVPVGKTDYLMSSRESVL